MDADSESTMSTVFPTTTPGTVALIKEPPTEPELIDTETNLGERSNLA